MLQFNYHTHTPRCRHANGTEREYIENAIRCGMHTLGFSDHAPQMFQSEYYSHFRMFRENAEEYTETLSALREEYKDQITLKIGYEMEYYPAIFQDTLAFVRQYPCEYLILGQHFLDNEEDTHRYSGSQTEDESYLADYVDQVCEAMRTGLFTYVAHPDLQNFVGEKSIYRRQYSRLIQCAIDTHTPLEINLLGAGDNRHYPNPTFWELVGEMGADTIIGCDAHNPSEIVNPVVYERAMALVEKNHLNLVEPTLRVVK